MDRGRRFRESSTNLRSQGSHTSAKSHAGKSAFTIFLLDGQSIDIHVEKKARGHDLFHQCCFSLSPPIQERDYFSLSFDVLEHKELTRTWLDFEKPVAQQMINSPNKALALNVKFYPPDPIRLQEYTLYLFYLQLRDDIVKDKIPTPFMNRALLASYVCQADIGDFIEKQDMSFLYDFPFGPGKNSPEFIDHVVDLWRSHAGMTVSEAEINYVAHVRNLPLYGTHLFLAADGDDIDIDIGINYCGINVFRKGVRMNRIVWSKILKLSYNRDYFYVRVKPADSDRYEKSVAFKLDSYKVAKRLWKISIEHHAFFRLVQPLDTTSGRIIFGSKPILNFQTEYQMKMNTLRSENRTVDQYNTHNSNATSNRNRNIRTGSMEDLLYGSNIQLNQDYFAPQSFEAPTAIHNAPCGSHRDVNEETILRERRLALDSIRDTQMSMENSPRNRRSLVHVDNDSRQGRSFEPERSAQFNPPVATNNEQSNTPQREPIKRKPLVENVQISKPSQHANSTENLNPEINPAFSGNKEKSVQPYNQQSNTGDINSPVNNDTPKMETVIGSNASVWNRTKTTVAKENEEDSESSSNSESDGDSDSSEYPEPPKPISPESRVAKVGEVPKTSDLQSNSVLPAKPVGIYDRSKMTPRNNTNINPNIIKTELNGVPSLNTTAKSNRILVGSSNYETDLDAIQPQHPFVNSLQNSPSMLHTQERAPQSTNNPGSQMNVYTSDATMPGKIPKYGSYIPIPYMSPNSGNIENEKFAFAQRTPYDRSSGNASVNTRNYDRLQDSTHVESSDEEMHGPHDIQASSGTLQLRKANLKMQPTANFVPKSILKSANSTRNIETPKTNQVPRQTEDVSGNVSSDFRSVSGYEGSRTYHSETVTTTTRIKGTVVRDYVPR